jgi:hypothetical protein
MTQCISYICYNCAKSWSAGQAKKDSDIVKCLDIKIVLCCIFNEELPMQCAVAFPVLQLCLVMVSWSNQKHRCIIKNSRLVVLSFLRKEAVALFSCISGPGIVLSHGQLNRLITMLINISIMKHSFLFILNEWMMWRFCLFVWRPFY